MAAALDRDDSTIAADGAINSSRASAQPPQPGEPADDLARPSGRIEALDGVRGIAIFLVLLTHFPPSETVQEASLIVTRLITGSWIGVDLFFVLSGFLITGILIDSRGGSGYFKNFYARRSLRIFPLYYGVLFALFVIGPLLGIRKVAGFNDVAAEQKWLWLYLSNLRIVSEQAPVFRKGFFDLVIFWSLAVEEQFYLIWPALVFVFARRGMIAMCLACMAMAAAIRVYLVQHETAGDLGQSLAIYVLTPARLDALAAGALVALLIRRDGESGIDPLRLRRAAKIALPVCITSTLLLLGIFAYERGFWLYVPLVQTAGYSLLAIAFASWILILVAAGPDSSHRALMTLQPLRWLGKYSYGIYVMHALLLPIVLAWLPTKYIVSEYGWMAAAGVNTCVGLACSGAAAWISFHCFEKHFLKLKRFFPEPYSAPVPTARAA